MGRKKVGQIGLRLCFWLLTFFSTWLHFAGGSKGDHSLPFQTCLRDCSRFFANQSPLHREDFLFYHPNKITFHLLQWNVFDECKYQCMHICESARSQAPTWEGPLQYFGKWPFIRVLGIQEFFSVLFSLAHLVAHRYGYAQTRRVAHSTSLYWGYFMASSLAWISSVIFHCKDTKFTEFLDYSCAFASLLVALFLAIDRVFLHGRILARILRIGIGLLFLGIWLIHCYRMAVIRFDYSFNMQVNAIAVILHAATWVYWVRQHPSSPFRRKIILFLFLFSLASLFEILDFPPLWGLLDAHAFWHASTVLLVPLYWSFLRDEYEAAHVHGKFQILCTKIL